MRIIQIALTILKVADEYLLHVWVPSRSVAKECVNIGHELASQLPNCTVMTVVVVMEMVMVMTMVMKFFCFFIIFVTSMQMWITVCDEPNIYSNKSSMALKAALHAAKSSPLE